MKKSHTNFEYIVPILREVGYTLERAQDLYWELDEAATRKNYIVTIEKVNKNY